MMVLLTISNRENSYLQFMTVLIIFIFVLAVTVITTRWIANYQKGKSASAGIEVVETHRITSNKYIQIVRIGEKYIAIGVGKDEIAMLTELKEEELNLAVNAPNDTTDFKAVLEKVKTLINKENGKIDE